MWSRPICQNSREACPPPVDVKFASAPLPVSLVLCLPRDVFVSVGIVSSWNPSLSRPCIRSVRAFAEPWTMFPFSLIFYRSWSFQLFLSCFFCLFFFCFLQHVHHVHIRPCTLSVVVFVPLPLSFSSFLCVFILLFCPFSSLAIHDCMILFHFFFILSAVFSLVSSTSSPSFLVSLSFCSHQCRFFLHRLVFFFSFLDSFPSLVF